MCDLMYVKKNQRGLCFLGDITCTYDKLVLSFYENF